MDVPEKEAHKVMQTNTLLPSFTLSFPAGQSMGRQAYSLSGTEMVHAFNIIKKEFCPL